MIWIALTLMGLLFGLLPYCVRQRVRRDGTTVLCHIYIHRHELEYMVFNGHHGETLPSQVGQLYLTDAFKRATQSTHQNVPDTDFRDVMVRATVRELGVVKCYEGVKSLGKTPTVMLMHHTLDNVDVIGERFSEEHSVSLRERISSFIVWYSAIQLTFFSNGPRMGYRHN